ncbi:MAG: ATP synthase subunit I [Acidobacteriota bacterium]|nr:ATP synthase subunit I [Acidobacteriota bacterium]
MIDIALFALLGAGLAALAYAGLWWTVRLLADSSRPLLLIAMSWMLRALPVLGAAVWLMLQGRWAELFATVGGFIVARLALTLIYGGVPGLRR